MEFTIRELDTLTLSLMSRREKVNWLLESLESGSFLIPGYKREIQELDSLYFKISDKRDRLVQETFNSDSACH